MPILTFYLVLLFVENFMRVADFSFDLPEHLIARYPKADRSASRLMTLDGNSGVIEHQHFVDVIDKLNAGDLLIFNNNFSWFSHSKVFTWLPFAFYHGSSTHNRRRTNF